MSIEQLIPYAGPVFVISLLTGILCELVIKPINQLKHAYGAKIKELEAEKGALITENHMLRTEIQKGDQTE